MALLDTRSSPRAETTSTVDRPARLTALDGLRGVSVLAVMAFHAGLSAVRGGLLGVDVFFVLSGFLITALFLREHQRNGRVSLRGFWFRRARRLLPAVVVMVAVVYTVSWFTSDPSMLPVLKGDALATLGYVANWHFAIVGQGYFDQAAAPSPLLHMWSLAVEEQYYLLWPLAVVVLLSFGGPRRLARVALLGAALSSGWLLYLSLEGVSTTRLYYGTDTRIAPLLVGSALATTLTPFNGGADDGPPRRTRYLAATLSALALPALVAALLRVDGQASQLYEGGFLCLAVVVALLITGVLLAPAGPVARLLSVPPLRALGRISYGVYLWHWPTFLFLSAAKTGLKGPTLLGVRVSATLVIATLSWFLLERPLLRWRPHRPALRAVLPGTAVVTIGGLVAGLLLVPMPRSTVPTGMSTVDLDKLAAEQAAAPPPPPRPAVVTPASPTRVLVVGDSTALTLGIGFADVSHANDTILNDRGRVGCGITTASPMRVSGRSSPMIHDCYAWEQHWTDDVATYDPDVAVVLLGRWEVPDRYFNGHWARIGDPDYDAYLSAQLERGIEILQSHGAKVVLMTAPYYSSSETADGSQASENDPARVDRWNQLLRDAASRHSDTVQVYDLGAALMPHGHYQRYTDDGRLELRSADGIHIGLTGGQFLGYLFLPQFRKWALGEPLNPPPFPQPENIRSSVPGS